MISEDQFQRFITSMQKYNGVIRRAAEAAGIHRRTTARYLRSGMSPTERKAAARPRPHLPGPAGGRSVGSGAHPARVQSGARCQGTLRASARGASRVETDDRVDAAHLSATREAVARAPWSGEGDLFSATACRR
jgi:hypothetical protein